MNDHVKNLTKELLSDYKCKLEKVSYDYLRSEGNWQHQDRVVFTRPDASVALLYNKVSGKIILINQFRIPTYVNGNDSGMLLEACAGTIDKGETPEGCIKREIEEETGYHIKEVKPVFDVYLSPGSVTERLYFFTAEYNAVMKKSTGGGTDETEDIAIKEILFEEAVAMIGNGKIKDAKTVMLLQYAQLQNLFS